MASNKKRNPVLDEYVKKENLNHGRTSSDSRRSHSQFQLRQSLGQPETYKRQSDSNVFDDYSRYDLQVISSEELIRVWKHYDRKDVGALALNNADWLRLAKHLVTRIEDLYIEDYVAALSLENPSLTPKEMEFRAIKALNKERPYLFPGDGKDHDSNASDMASYLFRNMNVQKDSKVTMQEFCNKWGGFMPKYFIPRSQQNNSKTCSML